MRESRKSAPCTGASCQLDIPFLKDFQAFTANVALRRSAKWVQFGFSSKNRVFLPLYVSDGLGCSKCPATGQARALPENEIAEIQGILAFSIRLRACRGTDLILPCASSSPPPSSIPLPLRTLREAFLRPTSAMARQDAAPPEVARRLGNGQRGRAEEGGLSGAWVDMRLQKTLGFSLGFRFSEASRAGRPRPDGAAAALPRSMAAERVSGGAMLSLPMQCRRAFVGFLSFCANCPPSAPRLRRVLPSAGRKWGNRGGLRGKGGLGTKRRAETPRDGRVEA